MECVTEIFSSLKSFCRKKWFIRVDHLLPQNKFKVKKPSSVEKLDDWFLSSPHRAANIATYVETYKIL